MFDRLYQDTPAQFNPNPLLCGVPGGIWKLNPHSVSGNLKLQPDGVSCMKKSISACAVNVIEPVIQGSFQWEIEYQPIPSVMNTEGWLLLALHEDHKPSVNSYGDRNCFGWNITQSRTNNGEYKAGKFTQDGQLIAKPNDIIIISYYSNSNVLHIKAASWERKMDIPASTTGYYLHFNPGGASFIIRSCMPIWQ